MLKLAETFFKRSYNARFNKWIFTIFILIFVFCSFCPLLLMNLPITEIIYTEGRVVPSLVVDIYSIGDVFTKNVWVTDNEKVNTNQQLFQFETEEIDKELIILERELALLYDQNPEAALINTAEILKKQFYTRENYLTNQIKQVNIEKEKYLIRSPLNGICINSQISPYEKRPFKKGDKICSVVSSDSYIIKTSLESKKSNKIKIGQDVLIEMRQYKMAGKILAKKLIKMNEDDFMYQIEINYEPINDYFQLGDEVKLKIIIEPTIIKQLISDKIKYFQSYEKKK